MREGVYEAEPERDRSVVLGGRGLVRSITMIIEQDLCFQSSISSRRTSAGAGRSRVCAVSTKSTQDDIVQRTVPLFALVNNTLL